jgi:5'-phosphate synthase pdxT subunit
MKVGVLAIQGAVSEHINMLKRAGAEALAVKTAEGINAVDGLILPGGESTTIGRLIRLHKIDDVIKERVAKGMPIYGTCAGMILLSRHINGFNQSTLELIDATVIRNAFGRQVDSMEVDLTIKGFDAPFYAAFIRAPVAKSLGKDVEILSELPEGAVFVKQGNILASSFHPELGNDLRIHKYFLDIVKSFLDK